MDYELSEESEVRVGMDQGSILSLLLLAAVIDIVTQLAREDVLSELLYVDDLLFIIEAIVALRNK